MVVLDRIFIFVFGQLDARRQMVVLVAMVGRTDLNQALSRKISWCTDLAVFDSKMRRPPLVE